MQYNCWSTNAQPTLADPVDWRPTKTKLAQTAANHFMSKQGLCWSRHIVGIKSLLQKTWDYPHIVAYFCNCSGFESLTTDEKFKRLRGSSFAVVGYARFINLRKAQLTRNSKVYFDCKAPINDAVQLLVSQFSLIAQLTVDVLVRMWGRLLIFRSNSSGVE